MAGSVPGLSGLRVLVTGADGLLGSRLTPLLEASDAQVAVFDGDIRGFERTAGRCDVVCHLAGMTKPSGTAAWEMFDVNVAGTLSVMRWCGANGVRCVLASSSAVYHPSADGPLAEDAELGPVLLYGASKALAERVCQHFASMFDIGVAALRVFNMYGAGQQHDFLVPWVVATLARGDTVELREPERVRDFVYVDDVARAFAAALATPVDGFAAINVGTGVGVNLRELANRAAATVGAAPDLIHCETGSGPDHVVADTSRAAGLLGWRSAVSLDQGLAAMASGD